MQSVFFALRLAMTLLWRRVLAPHSYPALLPRALAPRSCALVLLLAVLSATASSTTYMGTTSSEVLLLPELEL